MRLWSLHPLYLDSRGLVALWREGLLARAVIAGKTAGYRQHPQLLRFWLQDSPLSFIVEYLRAVHAESVARGYRFDGRKIGRQRAPGQIDVPEGQIEFEWSHLMNKLATRAPERHHELLAVTLPLPHPLFRVVPGAVAEWEKPKSLFGIDRGRIEILGDIIEPLDESREAEEA